MAEQTQDNLNEEQYEKEMILSELVIALKHKDIAEIRQKTRELHPADVAELLQNLDADDRQEFLHTIKDDFDPEILTELEPELIEEITELLGTKESADMLAQLDSDEVVEFIEELEQKEQQEIIDALPEQSRVEVEESLSYPDDSVGRLMRKRYVTVPQYWNVGQVLDYLRSQEDLPEDFHVIYIVDPKHRPVQYVLTSRVMRNKRDVLVTDIALECKHLLMPETDQEEAAHLFQKYGLVTLAVINSSGRIIGVLTTQDIVEVIQEESEEDFMRLGGITSRDFYSKIYKVVGKRTPWLLISAVNAFISAFVIMQFTHSIKMMITLAALSPMVAAMAGNAGSQALTVTITAIATRNLNQKNSKRFIGREMAIGFINGLVVAAFASIGVFAIHHNLEVTAIFAFSIICCFTMAGVIGSSIPVLLRKFGFDPTVASSAFVTAMTDITSFFVFLSLATAFLIG